MMHVQDFLFHIYSYHDALATMMHLWDFLFHIFLSFSHSNSALLMHIVCFNILLMLIGDINSDIQAEDFL